MKKRTRTIAGLGAVAVWLGLVSCRTPVLPPVRPVASLYPTLNAAGILDEVQPVDMSVEGLRDALAQARLLTELQAFGLSEVELLTATRGLQRRGYAEIDARRSQCPVRWVVFRPIREDDRQVLSLEAGLRRRPSLALEAGMDLSVPPAETEREDVYGRQYKVLNWTGAAGDVPVAVRRVFEWTGKPLHWELACTFPLNTRTTLPHE